MRSDGVLPVELPDAVREALLAPLVDHNCHGVCRDDLTRARFETLLTDAGTPAPPGTTHFDTPAGAAVRRWCAPVLGLAPHVPPAVYLARRMELGAAEVNRRLLDAAGIATFLFDGSDGSDGFDGFDDSDGPGPEGFGGFEGSGDLGGPGGRGGAGGLGALGGSRGSEGPGAVDRLDRPDRFDAGLGGAGVPPRTGTGHAGGAETARVVHIERAEEEVAGTAVSGVSYISALAQNLAERAARAVALKSVTAHRSGHHLDPARPSRGAVIAAATRRLACPGRNSPTRCCCATCSGRPSTWPGSTGGRCSSTPVSPATPAVRATAPTRGAAAVSPRAVAARTAALPGGPAPPESTPVPAGAPTPARTAPVRRR